MAGHVNDSNECESEFWRFSLKFYGQPGVPALCIALQDNYGIDANLLFYLIFLGFNGRRLTPVEVRPIDDSVRDWRENVVQPLRAVRRGLKTGIAPVEQPAAEALRSAVKRAELQAERLQQEALERQFPVASAGLPALAVEATRANIAAYFETKAVGKMRGTVGRASCPPENPVEQLLTSLAAAFPAAIKP